MGKQDTKNDDQNIKVTRLKSFELMHTPIIPGLLWHLLFVKKGVVHVHVANLFSPDVAFMASKLTGTPYIAQLHCDVKPSGKAGFLLKLYKPIILKRVLSNATYVVVFDEEQKVSVNKKYGISLSKIKVIPNGVDRKFFYDTPHELHQRPRLLFVGRLSIQKNLEQLLRALEGVSKQFDTTIVGDGEQEVRLKKLTKELGLKNVTFFGRASGQTLLNLYKSSDIFLLTSETEGMPLVLLEAMAMGLPIIGTNVEGIRSLVTNGKNGFLVPLGDTLALQTSLLNLSSSKYVYRKMSKTARAFADQYSWRKVGSAFEELYKEFG